MRILLQHAADGLYVTEAGKWTRNLAEALDFGSSLRAIGYLRQHQMSDVQVLVVFSDSGVIDTVSLKVPPPPSLQQAA